MSIKRVLLSSFLLAMVTISSLPAPGADSAAPAKPKRIGVYDSRVLAYAHFWSESEQRELKKTIAAAKEAQAKGDTNHLGELKARIKQRQEHSHLQVFSTAPVDDVMASIKAQAAQVQKQAGVSCLLSKWDEAGLAPYQSAEKVDVTEQLLGAFKLDASQRKVASDITKHDPLPLAKAKELLRAGKL